MKQSKPLGLVYAIVLIDIIAGSIMWPVWPQFVKAYAHPELLLALGTAIFIGIQLFTAPLLGRLSDIYGRKPVFIVSAVGTFLANLLLLPRNAFAYFSNRGADGLTNGVYSAVRSAITDISEEEDLMKNMGLEGTVVSLGFVLGPLVASGVLLLFGVLPEEATTVLVATGIGISLLNIVLSIILPETIAKRVHREPGELRQLVNRSINVARYWKRLQVLGQKQDGLLRVVILQLCLTFSLGYYNYLITYISLGSLQLTPQEISYFFAYFGIVFLVVSYIFYSYLIQRVQPERFLRITAALGIITHISYAFIGQAAWALYVVVTIDCLTIGLLPGIMDGLLARYAEQDSRGELFGITQALNGLASFGTTLVFGGLSVISLTLPFYWFALCLVPLLFPSIIKPLLATT